VIRSLTLGGLGRHDRSSPLNAIATDSRGEAAHARASSTACVGRGRNLMATRGWCEAVARRTGNARSQAGVRTAAIVLRPREDDGAALDDGCERDELARDHDGGANPAHTLAVSGSIIGLPASSAMRIPSRFT